MIFRSRSKSFGQRQSSESFGFSYRPLLHVLAAGQIPDDFEDPIENTFREQEVIISRAELDLRRAFQSLMVHTRLLVNSLEVVTALQLPGTTAALFWAIRLLLDDKLPAEMTADHLIRKRDQDSRLLYQALAGIDLDYWYETIVDKASITALPVGLQFPPGHPVAQRYYRQHPLPAMQQVYLPVTDYFSGLLYERRQELLRLLVTLGATRIEIQDLCAPEISPEVMEYPGRLWTPNQGLNLAEYAWLPYEPTWQNLLSDRTAGLMNTMSFDLTLDVNGMLAMQIAAMKNLTAQLNAVEAVDNSKIDCDYLKPQRVTVTFAV
ncbi:MAG: hypothetical protein HC929_00965 [Leptolyngbyaceae cyanobacterium SM2_5_2]|nr:hypothetical protein [Leptolyngbyaceae cyanobacterium SM2_5_2]